MDNNIHNPNVTFGEWKNFINETSTMMRVCTYADLVVQALPVSGDVLHDLSVGSDLSNVFILNGRKTLPYQQLSHSNDVKVRLRSSSTDEINHIYRFDGEDGQLMRFSCDDTYQQDGSIYEYSYSQCVDVNAIHVIQNTHDIRFRFRNITYQPYITFTPNSLDGYCTDVSVYRRADQIDPHDVWIRMMDGRKAQFGIGYIENGSSIPVNAKYIGNKDENGNDVSNYNGSISEYNRTYGGSVELSWTQYDKNNPPVDITDSKQFDWIEVEPYHGMSYVNVVGRRNKSIYIEVQTDSHIAVRSLDSERPHNYDDVPQYGHAVVLPPDSMGYFTTPTANPGVSIISLYSQSLDEWDAYEGYAVKVDPASGNELPDTSVQINKVDFNDQYTLSINALITHGNESTPFDPNYQYRVVLKSRPTFKSVRVNVNDDKNLTVQYLVDGTDARDTSARRVGSKWIHTFDTVEQSTLTAQQIMLKVIVTSETNNGHPEDVGEDAKYAIAKVSRAANVDAKVDKIKENGVGANATVLYEHQSSLMPRVLNLYVRLLENIQVTFYMPLDFYIMVHSGQQYIPTKPPRRQTVYGTVTVPFDAENDAGLNEQRLQFTIHRQNELTSGFNTLRGKFYYGSSFDTLGNAIFDQTSYHFSRQETHHQITVSKVSFTSTSFSIEFIGSMESVLTIKFVMPDFLDAYTLNTLSATTEDNKRGAYLGLLLTSGGIDGKGAIWNGGATQLLSQDSRPTEWSRNFDYTFNLSSANVSFGFSVITANTSNGYLPSYLIEKVEFTTNESWASVEHTSWTLTNQNYTHNTGSYSSPAFNGILAPESDSPTITIKPILFEYRPIVYFAMQKIPVVDVDGQEHADAGYIDQPKYVTPDENNEIGIGVSTDSTLNSFVRNDLGYSSANIYQMTIPDFYRTHNTIRKSFGMRFKGNIEAGEEVSGVVYPLSIVQYKVDAYIQTSNKQWSNDESSKIQTDGGPYENDSYYYSADTLGTAVPWTTSAAALNRNLLLVLKPILGEPLLSIVHMTYFTGTGDTEAAKLSDIVLSPVYRASGANNVIAKFYIKCNDKDDIVNPEWSFDGSENFTFWVEKETGTINSKQYTHIAYIYEDQDLFEYNENEEEVFATNQKLKFVLSYRSKNGSKTFRRTLSLTVGPVARMTTTADTFMNQASGTTTTLTMKVEEYVLVGSTITKVTKTPIFNTNDDEYIIELPDGASEPTTRYKFKLDFWQGTGSTDQFKTYFEIESITGSSIKVRVKDNVTAPVGTLDAFINCTYLPNTNLKYYNDSVATVQVRDNMTISGIHYWTATPTEGNFYGAMSLDKAFMPPVERTAGTDDDKWTLRMYIKLRDTTTMTVSTATFSIASPYNEEIETTIVKSGGTIDTTVGTQTYEDVPYDIILKARIKANVSLDSVNNRLCFTETEQHPERARYYTNLLVPFQFTIGGSAGFQQTLRVPMGAVLFQFTDNTTGGYLKPETDAFHILRVRGGEWYMNNSGVVVRPGMDYGSDNGRNYHVEFKYGNTVIPEYPASGEASEKGTWVSNRHNTFFDINARAVWTKDGKTWGSQDENHDGYPDGDWGAWRIDVINDEDLDSDTMTATMQITDSATEAHQYGWYPSKSVTLDVCDFMNIKEVTWWDGTQTRQKTTLRNALLPPVSKGVEGICDFTIKFPEGHGLDLTNVSISGPEPYHTSHDKTGDNQVSVSITLSEDIGKYDDNANHRTFYTGQMVPFVVDIGSFSDTVYLKLGPVISIHNAVANGKFWNKSANKYDDVFGGYLNAETGQRIVLQSCAHEWYLENGVIVNSDNSTVGNPNDRTRRGRTYNITWAYSGASDTITETSVSAQVPDNELLTGESSYNFTRRYVSDHLKIEHAATWSEPTAAATAGATGRYHNDGGAWRVEVTNADGLDDGTLTALVTVEDTGTVDVPMHHWYDGGKTTTLLVSGFNMELTRIDEINLYDKSSLNRIWTNRLSIIPIMPSQTFYDGQIQVSFKITTAKTVDTSKISVNFGKINGFVRTQTITQSGDIYTWKGHYYPNHLFNQRDSDVYYITEDMTYVLSIGYDGKVYDSIDYKMRRVEKVEFDQTVVNISTSSFETVNFSYYYIDGLNTQTQQYTKVTSLTATTELTAAVWNGNNFVLLSNYFSENSDKLVLGVPSISSYGTPTAKNNSVEASVIEKPGGLKFLSITVYYITANGTVSSNCVEFDYQIKNNM